MDPAVGVVQKHDADARTKKPKNVPCRAPVWAEKESNHILAGQGKSRAERHADKSCGRKGVDQYAVVFARLTIQPAQHGYCDHVDRVDHLAGGKEEKVIGFLIEAQCNRPEAPAHEQVVHVANTIVDSESSIDTQGKPHASERSLYT